MGVAIDGDRVAVGAAYDDRGANKYSGRVYVFDRNRHVVDSASYLIPNDLPRGESFGESVTLKGDVVAAQWLLLQQRVRLRSHGTVGSAPSSIAFTNVFECLGEGCGSRRHHVFVVSVRPG